MSTTQNRRRTTQRAMNRAKLKLAALRFSQCKVTPPFYEPIATYYELFNDRHYKYILLKGGRGSGKSFAIDTFFIEESFNIVNKDSLFIFAREVQTSINESVYALTKSMIEQAHLGDYFTILRTKIINKLTGVEFVFIGLRSTGGKTAFSQVNKIKGKFNVRYIFVDEAQDLTEDTINVLLPTVNRGSKVGVIEKSWHPTDEQNAVINSRLFFAMNPNFDNDPIVMKIQGLIDDANNRNERPNGVIKHVNIFDIPKRFQDPQLLEQARAEVGEIYYAHVWEGEASHKISGYPWAALNSVNTNEKIECFCAFLDPSFKGGDYTAISFLGKHGNDLCVWGYCVHLAWNKAMDSICEMIERYKPNYFYYEDNSLGTVPLDIFAERGINAIAHTTLGNKEARIYKVAGFVAHRAHLITNLCNTQYINNVLKYNEDAEFDDGADSLASVVIKSGLISEKMKF